MPPGLVVLIRANVPDAVFPASDPDSVPWEPEEEFSPVLTLPELRARPATLPVLAPPVPADDLEPLAWLLATLRTAIEGVMADDEVKPLHKANAVSRLGNLYLKTYRATELTRENKALSRRIAELEAELVTATGVAARLEAINAASRQQADDRSSEGEGASAAEGHEPALAERRTSQAGPADRRALPRDLPEPAAGSSDLRSGWRDPP